MSQFDVIKIADWKIDLEAGKIRKCTEPRPLITSGFGARSRRGAAEKDGEGEGEGDSSGGHCSCR